MKAYTHLITAACLLAGGALAAAPATGADVVVGKTTVSTDAKGTHTATLMLPAGIQQKDLKALGGVESALTNLAEDAVSKNGFDNLVGYLVEQDRKRMADKKNMNVDDLNTLADSLNQTWKNKYGQKFGAKKNQFDNFLTVLTGEVADPDQLVGHWPVDPGPAQKHHSITAVDNTGGKVTPADAAEAKKTFGGTVKLEKGRNVALVHIPASHGLPPVTASMVHEATGWRFDIPNTIDADTLRKNLFAALAMLNQKKDWPDDGGEAARFATHAIIGALYGVDLKAGEADHAAHKMVTDKP